MQQGDDEARLTKYLSPIGVWALSFGCAVGWGAFVMPGTTFLPIAGPLGTAIGIGVGAVVMFIIGVNYHFLMNCYPVSGGTLSYSTKVIGYDHGFLSAWFLVLVYVAIMWANATALPLIFRYLFGQFFQFGFHYQILGYDVYFGETLLSSIIIVIFSLVGMSGKRISISVQIAGASVLFLGVALTFVFAVTRHDFSSSSLLPSFAPASLSPDGKNPFLQIFHVIALAPWAFVGFESVSHASEELRFSSKKTIWILLAALVTSALSYIMLSFLSVSLLPDGFSSWTEYISSLSSFGGIERLPTFFASERAMGRAGLFVLGLASLGAIITGLLGNSIAASRLLYAMSKENILPEWFGKIDKNENPRNTFFFLMLVSVFIPLLGRTAIGWIVDVTTIGATIAYAYTSASAFIQARKLRRKQVLFSGAFGFFISVGFFLYFMFFSGGALAAESYLILAIWGFLGAVFFRVMFKKDRERRFGKSTVVWLGLLFMIFFTTLMWVRQATGNMIESVIEDVSAYYESHNPTALPEMAQKTEHYISMQMERVKDFLTQNSTIQMFFLVAALAIMFSVYRIMIERQKQAEEEKTAAEIEREKAEQSNKAKSTFLSNMSHDIRTPMNAIIGYTNLALRDGTSLEEIKNFLSKISSSSQHLLALINDVLEMSRIESGKMELEPVPVNFVETISEVRDMFATQMAEKQIDFFVDSSQVKNPHVLCDKNRLNRVLLNLVSNAYKFTPEGGTVSISLWQIENASDESSENRTGIYELRVKDSGIGMSPEFAEKVFDSFERERTSTVSGIQGTGLGMAIAKSIVDLMGGEISVNTRLGEGTEFIVRLVLPLQEDSCDNGTAETALESSQKIDFSTKRILLVEDMEINRELAKMILTDAGFSVETAENGAIAVEKVENAEPNHFDAILMDIQMPVMDGYTAAKTIRSLPDSVRSKIPIVAMTANAFSEDVLSAKEAGMNGHVAKPIDVEKLMAMLTKVLSA